MTREGGQLREAAERLDEAVDRQSRRLRRAERERHGVLAHTVFLGTLGFVFVLPLVGGAYVGHWLDRQQAGYSMRWTLSFLALGLVVGVFNVYFLFRDWGDGQR